MEVSILKTLELKIQNLEVKSKSSDHSLQVVINDAFKQFEYNQVSSYLGIQLFDPLLAAPTPPPPGRDT